MEAYNIFKVAHYTCSIAYSQLQFETECLAFYACIEGLFLAFWHGGTEECKHITNIA